MDSLNANQRSAVEAGDGPLAIIAGPGTGKTKTLVARIEYLIKSGISPASILALTFTKKAAQEMAERLSNTAGPVVRSAPQNFIAGTRQKMFAGAAPPDATRGFAQPTISTFHALCFELLREKEGVVPDFISESARFAVIKKLPKPAVFKSVSTRELGLLISRAKNMADDNADVARLTKLYNTALNELKMHDFDDLLLKTRDFLQNDAAWRTRVQARFTHILVDEFQDTNALQYELLQLLRQNQNVFVIGDPQQSIYGFRGADGDIFARFLDDFEAAKIIVLDINYRSAQAVVNLANAIYPDQPALSAHSKKSGQVQAIEVLNEYREADWVLAEIQKAIGGSDLQRAVSNDAREQHGTLRDFAVLYRNRSVARALQKTFEFSGLPFQVVGEGSPYDQPHVQTILQILAMCVDPERQAVIKDFSRTQIAVLTAKLDTTQMPHLLAEQIVTLFALPVDATIRHLFGILVRFKTLAEAVQYFDALATQDFYDPQADAITLLTIHAAKGLEFSHVFLIGAEDGVLPSSRANVAEEKRLFYVAATRAKERLDILFAHKRAGESAIMSRFITTINQTVLPRARAENFASDQKKAQKRQAKRSQTSLF